MEGLLSTGPTPSSLNIFLHFVVYAGRIEAAYSELKELFEPCCCPLNGLLFKYLLTFIGPMLRIGQEIQCLPYACFFFNKNE